MAERVGFEPTVGGYPTHDFQSCTFDHSAISPQKYFNLDGGEGGIRTHGDHTATPVFETGPFDHSGTSPQYYLAARRAIKNPLSNSAHSRSSTPPRT